MAGARTGPQIAHWWKAAGALLPAQTRAVGESFAGTGNVSVEFLVDGIWTDMALLGLVLADDKVNVKYGKSSEASVADPSSCSFTLKNNDSAFSFLNPESVYYQKVDRGTEIRVAVPSGGGKSYRFHGELVGLNQTSDISGGAVEVSFEAAGALRRYSQGSAVLDSPIFRETMHFAEVHTNENTRLLAYWPMEDASGSTTLAAAVGTRPMTYTGTPSLAAYDGFPCSKSLPSMQSGTFTAKPNSYTPANYNSAGAATGDHGVEINFLISCPSGITNGAEVLRATSNGLDAAVVWKLTYPSTDHLQLTVYDFDGNLLADSGSTAVTMVGITNQIRIRFRYDHPTDLFVEVHLYNTVTGAHSFGPTLDIGGGAVGRFGSIGLNAGATKTAVDYYVGHLTLREILPDSLTLNPVAYDSLNAYAGETADARFVRLCQENSITSELTGTSGDGVAMGYQSVAGVLDLIRECEAADGGILYEPPTFLGLGYRTRRSMQNQDPVITLPHSQNALQAVVSPFKDDSYLRNKWTVTRTGGTSYTAEVTTGRMSTSFPPAGVGPYEDSVELNVQTDLQAAYEASWRVHVSSVDEPRYTSMTVDLAHPYFAGTTRTDMLALRPGDRMVVSDVPQRLGFEDISQLAVGFSETIDKFEHVIVMNTSPESPYRTGVLGDADEKPRVNTDGSFLVGEVDTVMTSITVATQTGSAVWVDSATYASDFPFDIKINGEQMTVTAITGTSSPQTFTVTRSVNGVVRGHHDHDAVGLAKPTAVGM